MTEDTPQAEPEPNKATAPLSLTRGWLGIALSIGFLLGLGLLGWWFLSGMPAGDVVVESTPEPQEPAEQVGDPIAAVSRRSQGQSPLSAIGLSPDERSRG